MSLSELLPVVRKLPLEEQMTLVRTLADELLLADELGLVDRASYPVWSPWEAHEAAATLSKLLSLGTPTSSLNCLGLLDTGSAVNVLPYSVGLKLGLDWDKTPLSISLTGNLAALPARGIVLKGTVASFTPVRLAFAWTRSDTVPVILGQMNFFLEFEVCFFRARGTFEIKPK